MRVVRGRSRVAMFPTSIVANPNQLCAHMHLYRTLGVEFDLERGNEGILNCCPHLEIGQLVASDVMYNSDVEDYGWFNPTQELRPSN